MGIGSYSYCSSDLPEYILSLGAACEDHLRGVSLVQGSGYLKNPNSVWVALGIEVKVLVNQNSRTLFVESRL
jgi:hypothetical protein